MFPESDILRAASEALKRLGYSELRPQQEEVVRKLVQGHDVFVSLPTGSEKSLCYCILPEVFDILRKIAPGRYCSTSFFSSEATLSEETDARFRRSFGL